jgi:hypothetical protein
LFITIGVRCLLLSAVVVYWYWRALFITIGVRNLLLSAGVVCYYRRALFVTIGLRCLLVLVCVEGRFCFYSILMVLQLSRIKLSAPFVTSLGGFLGLGKCNKYSAQMSILTSS